MFDTFCVILLVDNGYTMECIPMKRELNYDKYCDKVVNYFKNVQTHRDFDGKWFGSYCTTKKEMATWTFNEQ